MIAGENHVGCVHKVHESECDPMLFSKICANSTAYCSEPKRAVDEQERHTFVKRGNRLRRSLRCCDTSLKSKAVSTRPVFSKAIPCSTTSYCHRCDVCGNDFFVAHHGFVTAAAVVVHIILASFDPSTPSFCANEIPYTRSVVYSAPTISCTYMYFLPTKITNSQSVVAILNSLRARPPSDSRERSSLDTLNTRAILSRT